MEVLPCDILENTLASDLDIGVVAMRAFFPTHFYFAWRRERAS